MLHAQATVRHTSLAGNPTRRRLKSAIRSGAGEPLLAFRRFHIHRCFGAAVNNIHQLKKKL